MKDKSRLFISYARSDGSTFAKDLRHHLIDEYHFHVWQDIVELEGGRDWWLQIEAAIKSVEFLVMVMTPGVLASQTTRKEWRLARQEGVCVLPVMAEEIDLTTLPRWMRVTHFFDFKYPEQWDRFIRTLQSPCQAPRVPFMVEDKPDDFVERPEEFPAAVQRICASPPPRLKHTYLYTELRDKKIATSHPESVTQLLRYFLPNAHEPFLHCNEVEELVRSLVGSVAQRPELILVCDDLARLGCPNAAELRKLVTENSHD